MLRNPERPAPEEHPPGRVDPSRIKIAASRPIRRLACAFTREAISNFANLLLSCLRIFEGEVSPYQELPKSPKVPKIDKLKTKSFLPLAHSS